VSEPLLIEKNNIKIAFLAFSDVGPSHMKAGTSTSGIILLSDSNLEKIVRNAKLKADKLIVGIHWGEEYINTPTERQKEFGHKIIDWGASVLVGHHPHVIEPAEKYNGGLIVYSLGNFVFDQNFSKETMEGNILYITFKENGVEEYSLQKIEIGKDFRPFFVDNI
jgi:poly-gamma-glutamate synthesis protein (capsule biosynthesis protein)